MIRTATVTIEELLEHSAWVRGLARQLVSDAATADDTVQNAWVAALSKPPLRGVPVRPWLARVVHNAVRMGVRTEQRRTQRELLVAREEAMVSAHDSVEQAERQSELVAALIALDEPYKTTLILRYFESLPPRTIAARLEVPVETVNTRLKRGLQRLRKQLEQRHGGDSSAWLAAWLPLARAQQDWTPGALGWISMNLKIPLAVAAVVVIGAIAWVKFQGDDSPAPSSGAHAASPAEVATKSEPPAREAEAVGVPAAADQRAAIAPPPTPSPALAKPEPAAVPVRGKVIDDLGRPMSGIAMVLQAPSGETARSKSGANGEFEFTGSARSGRILEDEESLCTVLAGVARTDSRERTPVVVAARRVVLAGKVVDEMGFGLAGVAVSAPEPEGFRTRFHEVLDLSEPVPVRMVSDANGLFRLESVAALSGARLTAVFDQFDPYDEELPAASDANLVITLQHTLARDGTLHGQVVDAAGQPAAEARVSFGLAAQSADSSGRFVFAIDDPTSMNVRFRNEARTLTAAKPGFLPAVFEPRLEDGKPQWPASITLHLGEPSLEIHGRVVGSHGDPISGVRVYIAEASILGGTEKGPIVLENFLAGAEDGPAWRFTQSDEDGLFTVDGLLPREYRVRAMDMDTLLIAESKPVVPGPDEIEIELDTAKLFPRVAGRIIGGDGKPVARASVRPMCDAFKVKHRTETVSTSHAGVDGTTTDSEGRFELKNVPSSLVYLRIDGEDIVPLEYGRWAEGDPRFAKSIRELPRDRIESLEIKVGRRLHFQVEIADPAFADEVAVLDGDGEAVELSVFSGNSRREGGRQPVLDGRSDVIACPDNGVMIVLRKNKAEVSRRKLELKAGEVTTVRF
ncbi:MAG TPA: sigma-70 family RNA polymerase sigma factor [Planctomycetota bacterium]|nr:sigma-70 family RNA polymerase sigma factor [Planctomycetota bacterium]